MMIDGIEDYYKRLASEIEKSIDDDWSSATLEAVFFDDASSYTGEYIRSEDGKARSLKMDSAMGKIFRELRESFQDSGKPLWGGAIFNLSVSGKFNMEWNYENCDENGDTIFDADAELKKASARNRRLLKE